MSIPDEAIRAAVIAWDKHMGGRYTPHEVEELSDEVRVILEVGSPFMALEPAVVEEALRQFVSREVDYDIHKQFECDEEDGSDRYPELAGEFVRLYNKAAAK